MTPFKTFLNRLGVAALTLLLTIYVGFRISYINLTPWIAPFAILLFLAELHMILHLYGMFYSLWPRPYPQWQEPNLDRNLRCNMFVCVCGEPESVVRETVKSALETGRVYQQTIDPIHAPRVFVINDGKVAKKDNWQDIEEMCRQEGVECITREIGGGFKAGNINNALKMTPTDDPFNTVDIIFDSDFCALPQFLVEIVKPLAEKEIDFVQSPQRYKNETTWVAKAAAAHQIFFFEHICPAKGWDNALFLCGTNFAIRRSALDAIGGMDTRFITEDYATSLELHMIGRRGVFMPRVLALGMSPTSLKQYFTQQRRWSKGNFDVTFHYMQRLLSNQLTFKQKMHYMLSATYYLIGLRDFILMMAPIPYLFFGISMIKPNAVGFLILIYGPMFVTNLLLFFRLFRHPIKSLILDIVSFPIFMGAFFSAIFKQQLGFVVTIKKYERENPLDVYKPQMALGLVLFAGIIYSFWNLKVRTITYGTFVNYWWAIFDVTFLFLGFYLLVAENASWGVWDVVQHRTGANRLGWKASLSKKALAVWDAVTLGTFRRRRRFRTWRGEY